MATVPAARVGIGRDEKFFLMSAIVMAMVLVGGFSFQLAMGRSTFASPLYVHAHALTFFGWTALYLLQNILAAGGSTALHRRLGWIATVMVPAMVVLGTFITVRKVQQGAAPFFFEPLYFLLMNPLSILVFAGLVASAILLRRHTQWHRRLMFCGMAILTGPGLGRLLPMPLFIPWAGWAVFAAVMLFPLAGIVRDLRGSGTVHPAWWWGVAAIAGVQMGAVVLAGSPVGPVIYRAVTQGTPGAAITPNAYPPMPGA
ncbi:hypothetical protein [Sphingobium aquiterrae]|uniref:hypothetical protein n=1 Tax=Sphingobium aquiterrae TaxID=2038656 RepID=UPI003018BD93